MGVKQAGDIMFDLNYQQSHRRLLGPLPRAGCVCGIQTGDSPVTSGSALEEGPGAGCSCGTWRHSYSSFFNLLDMTPPASPPPQQALTGQTTSNIQLQSLCVCVCVFAGQVGDWAVVGSQMG